MCAVATGGGAVCIHDSAAQGGLTEREAQSEGTNLAQWDFKISSDLWSGKHQGKNGFG